MFAWWGAHDVYTALAHTIAQAVGAEEMPDTLTDGVSCTTVRERERGSRV